VNSNEVKQARVRSCGDYFEISGKITLTGLSVAALFLCTKIQGTWPMRFHGFEINERQAYAICGITLFTLSFADLLVFYRISKLLKGLGPADLNQIRLHSSVWNFLADFGSSAPAQFQSCFAFGFLIIAWWIGYAAVSVLNPYRWDVGFELVLLGSGMLSLGAIMNCKLKMRRAKAGSTLRHFQLPLLGSITIEDAVVAPAVTIGSAIAYVAERFV
jgi:hypothetical protein